MKLNVTELRDGITSLHGIHELHSKGHNISVKCGGQQLKGVIINSDHIFSKGTRKQHSI